MATKNLKFVTEYWQNLDVMWYMLAAKRLKCKCRLKMAAFLASNLFIKVLSPISVFVSDHTCLTFQVMNLWQTIAMS